MAYLSYNKHNVITGVSDRPFSISNHRILEVKDDPKWKKLIGRKLQKGIGMNTVKPVNELRVAVVCNWNDKCGISTYSQYLLGSMSKQVKDIKIFSEVSLSPTGEDEANVVRCWKRGEKLRSLITKIKEYNPDFLIIQHEYGIFPNACHFMNMLNQIEDIPYVVTMHSVYEHLDKAVYSSAIKNILVHTEPGKDMLRKTGNTSNIFVVPHGCLYHEDAKELWNICQNEYTILQYGFGFAYKGVDVILDAVAHLKANDPKFKDIFYCLLMSENPHTNRVHNEYYNLLKERITKLDIEDNVSIIRKWHSEDMINLYLREFKLAVFPYINNPDNTVYAASGAARIAMANKIPVICSNSHLFDDFEGVVPRPADYLELAKEIDEVFSNEQYKNKIRHNATEFIKKYSWDNVAKMYLDLYPQIVEA